MTQQRIIVSKTMYESPKIDIIQFSCHDIITTSKTGDSNQGEWDPQGISKFNEGWVSLQ